MGKGGSTSAGGAMSGGTGTGGSSSGGASGGASGAGLGGSMSGGSASGGASGGSSGSLSGGSSQGGVNSAGGQVAAQGGATSGGGSAGGAGAGAGGRSGGAGGGGGASGAAGASNGGSGGASGFTLTSPGWTSQPGCAPAAKTMCGVFPKENIGTNIGGGNKSPALEWTSGPSGTQSYAIVLHDLTNMMGGKPFVHWVMWNIPGATRMLPAGLETTAMPSVPAGSSQRAYSGNGFQGSGKCGNVYEFTLYALPMASFTPTGSTQTAVRDGLAATNAPTTTLRARSGAPGCKE